MNSLAESAVFLTKLHAQRVLLGTRLEFDMWEEAVNLVWFIREHVLSPSELPAPMAKDQPKLRSCPIITLTTMNVLDVRATCSLAELEIYSRRGTRVAPPAGGCVPSPSRSRRAPSTCPHSLKSRALWQRYPRSSHFAKTNNDPTVSKSEMLDLGVG